MDGQGPPEIPYVDLRLSGVNVRVLRADRPAVTRALAASLATAANPARGGLVREALAAHFPRLAQLLEDTLGRLARDTQARPPHTCTSGPTSDRRLARIQTLNPSRCTRLHNVHRLYGRHLVDARC